MTALIHTPYAERYKPFSIGLAVLDLADWIQPDENLQRDLAAKDRLFASGETVVFREEAASRPAQEEALRLLRAHLPARFPERYEERGGGLLVDGERRIAIDGADAPPLMTAGRLVQEDLLLMHKDEASWRLVAAALCFPSAWSLAEKFGATLDGLHEKVPGYQERLGQRMNRIFDALQVDLPVWRVNWSIYPDAELTHAASKAKPRAWFDGPDPAAFIRVERQTLRRLPQSGDLLFTVKILVDPFDAFRRHPEGAALALALRDQLLGLDPDQLAYKGLTGHAAAIAGHLETIAARRAG